MYDALDKNRAEFYTKLKNHLDSNGLKSIVQASEDGVTNGIEFTLRGEKFLLSVEHRKKDGLICNYFSTQRIVRSESNYPNWKLSEPINDLGFVNDVHNVSYFMTSKTENHFGIDISADIIETPESYVKQVSKWLHSSVKSL